MFFRQILHEDLGCASYFVADDGEAAVIDPKWEIDEYLVLARETGSRILHILETHNHADHVSGRRRLAEASGARIHLPADPGRPEEGGRPRDASEQPTLVRSILDGETVRVGRLRLQAIAAPGHRPEHLAFAVLAPGQDTPSHLLSGDSLLVGGVARPDLAVEARAGADAMFDTLRRFQTLDDEVELWPAHVGGSLCGSTSLTSATSSTIGQERQANPLFSVVDRTQFVTEVTAHMPTRPPRVDRVVELNLTGAESPAPPARLGYDALHGLLREGAAVLDVRDPDTFDQGHLQGSLNLTPASQGLGNRAGWATRPEEPIVLVAESFELGQPFTQRLYAAGIWNVVGLAVADPTRWGEAGLPVRSATAFTPAQVAEGIVGGELALIDVRDRGEYEVESIEASLHLPLSELADGSEVGLPRDQPFAVACAAGARGALAASVLQRAGYPLIRRMTGGIPDLARLLPDFALQVRSLS